MFEDLQSIDWRVVGLSLCLVGLFFILNSFYFKRPRRFLDEYVGLEKRKPLKGIRDYVMGNVQLVIGFVFMITGYFLQIAVQLSENMTSRSSFLRDPTVLTVATVLIGSMALVTLVLKVCQIFWTRWTFRRLLIDFFREQSWALEKYPQTAKEVGELLGVELRKEDSVSDYLRRLRQYLGVPANEAAQVKEATTVMRPRAGIATEAVKSGTHPATPPRIMG